VTRRREHRSDEADAVAVSRPAEPPPVPSLLDLQRSAGNAAVARMLAREPTADAPTLPQLTRPSLVLGAPNPLFFKSELPLEVEKAVDEYLTNQKPGILAAVSGGAISMPEVVDGVRRNVAVAASASPEGIRARVSAIVGDVPQRRGKNDLGGKKAAQEASIANMLPSPPTSVTVGGSKTSLTVRIAEAELKTAKEGAHVTAKADKEGAEAEVKKGDVKAGVSGKWDGSEFGVKTEVAGVKFGGKVQRKGDSWKWTGGLVFQLSGEEVDELPDISGAVSGAHTAIADSLGHLQGGGSLTDGYVTSRMGKIKPAIDAVGQVAGRSKSGATLRVTASAEDGGFTAGVSLVIVF
jgi:hypothetical protein